jgi:predicted nucleotidyltransferase component of viral defense system
MRLKIEINTREHFAMLGLVRRQVAADNPWCTRQADVTTYRIDELFATKLRALYQRKKGRDLFDLWLALSRGMLDPQRVVACFAEYMKHEGHTVSRAQFEQNLYDKQSDPAFLQDIKPLLRPDIDYDAEQAMTLVRNQLIERLPGGPWRGKGEEPTGDRPHKPRRRRT